jgi:hypothetical protein
MQFILLHCNYSLTHKNRGSKTIGEKHNSKLGQAFGKPCTKWEQQERPERRRQFRGWVFVTASFCVRFAPFPDEIRKFSPCFFSFFCCCCCWMAELLCAFFAFCLPLVRLCCHCTFLTITSCFVLLFCQSNFPRFFACVPYKIYTRNDYSFISMC